MTDAIGNIGSETTILIIAHRLTSLIGCDLVIELDDGRIKRQVATKRWSDQSLINVTLITGADGFRLSSN